MEKINSYECLKNKIDEYRACKCLSNFFLLQKKTKLLADNDMLTYLEQGRNLFVFEQAGDFLKMYYFIRDTSDVPEIKSEMPIVVELYYREKYNAKQETEAEYIQKIGFRLQQKSISMSVKAEDIILPETPPNEHITITPAKPEDQPKIERLMRESLDPHFLPTESDMKILIEDGRVLTMFYDGNLIGVQNLGPSDEMLRDTLLQPAMHFVMAPEFRGKKLGMAFRNYLMNEYFKKKNKGRTTWVHEDNLPIINFNTKMGFKPYDRRLDEYVLK